MEGPTRDLGGGLRRGGDGDEPGLVRFEQVNLFMGGPWEVTFGVESEAAGGDDEMKFYVCVKDD